MQLAIFVEDESNEGVMADPDTSPPASKKKRESPRKLRNRTVVRCSLIPYTSIHLRGKHLCEKTVIRWKTFAVACM